MPGERRGMNQNDQNVQDPVGGGGGARYRHHVGYGGMPANHADPNAVSDAETIGHTLSHAVRHADTIDNSFADRCAA